MAAFELEVEQTTGLAAEHACFQGLKMAWDYGNLQDPKNSSGRGSPQAQIVAIDSEMARRKWQDIAEHYIDSLNTVRYNRTIIIAMMALNGLGC